MSNSRCMRCRSVPWFSFRLVVTSAKNGFLASKGLGGEESSSVIGQALNQNLPAPKGPFWFHKTQGTLERASKGPRKPLQLCKSSPSPIQGSAPNDPRKWAELGYQCLHLQIRKLRLAPKSQGDPPPTTCL